MREQRLPGGKTVGATRVGDTVRRPVQPWTAAVHAVLRHLERAGFEGAPRALGLEGEAHEVLTYMSGETVGDRVPWPAWTRSDEALMQVGEWMRRLHDATASFVPPPGVTWFAGQAWRPGLVIGHHDVAPFNAVWRDGRLAGFFDWDTAGPSSRELDLAFAALTWVPLSDKGFAARVGFTDFDDRSRRLHLLLDSYGYEGDRPAFAAVVAQRAQINAEAIRRMAAGGDPAHIALLPMADVFEASAREVSGLPEAFWLRGR